MRLDCYKCQDREYINTNVNQSSFDRMKVEEWETK